MRVEDAPCDGRELYLWAKVTEARERVRLVALLSAWATLCGWPWRWAEWDADQVERAYRLGCWRLRWRIGRWRL